MRLSRPLIRGTLVKRYKRFLADVVLEDGREITAHCANTGAMTGLAEPGYPVWLLESGDPKRKLSHSWELVETPDLAFAGVNTNSANRIVAAALARRSIGAFAAYPNIRPEAKLGERSRADFLLTGPGLPDCWLEVKSVTLRRAGDLAESPDARTLRGQKHLVDLAEAAADGMRAALLFLVQHSGCRRFSIASDIDPAYGVLLKAAQAMGVEVFVYGCRFMDVGRETTQIMLDQKLPMVENGAITT